MAEQGEEKDKEKDKEKLNYKPLIILMAIIAALWALSIFAVHYIFPDWTKSGTFGDTFGAINSLFSGLAFAGIIFTIFLQKRELGLQRDVQLLQNEELELTREELKLTRQEFVQQNNTLKRQLFENTFFSMLSQHNQIVNSLDTDVVRYVDGELKSRGVKIPWYSYPQDKVIGNLEPDEEKKVRERYTISGRDVFEYHYKIFIQSIEGENKYAYEEAYHNYWEIVQGDFGHYFRNLYRILKLVKETNFYEPKDIDPSNGLSTKRNYLMQYKYTSILRAQLSDYELLWLFYNGLSKYGQDKFRPLINHFTILKNIPFDKLHDNGYKKTIINKYNKSAYKRIDLSKTDDMVFVSTKFE